MDKAVASTSASHTNTIICIMPGRCSNRYRFYFRRRRHCRRCCSFIGLLAATFLVWTIITENTGCSLVREVTSFALQPLVRVSLRNIAPKLPHIRICTCNCNCAGATTTRLHATTGFSSKQQEQPIGSRYVCLLEDYEKARGPYFYALFDQLFELTGHEKKRVAFLTTQKDLDGLSCRNDNELDGKGFKTNVSDNNGGGAAEALEALLETLQSSLELEMTPEVFVLDDWNPLAVEEHFSADDGVDSDNDHVDPTILWLYGNHNSFHTRHLLRTSGLDRYIQERCASSSSSDNDDNCVFVGEGTGSACVWITMDAASARGDDPKAAPELQAYGLKLLGNEYKYESTQATATATVIAAIDGVVFSEKASISDDSPGIEMCGEDEVFVWAQQPPQDSLAEEEEPQEHVATNFVMAPNRRGTIERYTTLDPLPPLVVRTEPQSSEGVACYGEPNVDPSRTMQAGTIGDSEWWE